MIGNRTLESIRDEAVKIHPTYYDIDILNKDNVNFRCKYCDIDKFSILNENLFKTSVKKLLRGYTICRCSRSYPKTTARLKMEVKDILGNTNFLIEGEISGNSTRILWECHFCKYENNTSVHNLIAGRGCTNCASYGFKGNKMSWLYVVKLENKGVCFYKVGKTNKEQWEDRLAIQSKKGGGCLVETLLVYKAIGHIISRVENNIKVSLHKFEKIPRDLHPDGFSECFFVSDDMLPSFMCSVGKAITGVNDT